jgi:hypothetical protein
MFDASIEPSAAPAPTENGLQPLLELAAVLRAGYERAHIERDDALVFQTFWNVTANDAARKSFDDRRLADTRLADEDRIVLGAAREDLDHAADFLVAADHGIELALFRELSEIAAVTLERLIRAFRVLGRHALRSADALQRGADRIARDSRLFEQLRGRGASGLLGQRDEQVFGADVLVLVAIGFGLRFVRHELQPR